MKKTTEIFKEEVFNLVGNEFTVISEYESSNKNIMMRHNCDKCGNFEYPVRPQNFIRGDRCPKCKESHGEKSIANYLNLKNINYKIEYRINDCKDKIPLPFDFAVFDLNNSLLGLIEYDGIQHFEPISFGCKDTKKIKNTFEIIKHHDQIKTTYCLNNNIPLLRIKYTDFDKIEKIIDEFLKEIEIKKVA